MVCDLRAVCLISVCNYALDQGARWHSNLDQVVGNVEIDDVLGADDLSTLVCIESIADHVELA